MRGDMGTSGQSQSCDSNSPKGGPGGLDSGTTGLPSDHLGVGVDLQEPWGSSS